MLLYSKPCRACVHYNEASILIVFGHYALSEYNVVGLIGGSTLLLWVCVCM